ECLEHTRLGGGRMMRPVVAGKLRGDQWQARLGQLCLALVVEPEPARCLGDATPRHQPRNLTPAMLVAPGHGRERAEIVQRLLGRHDGKQRLEPARLEEAEHALLVALVPDAQQAAAMCGRLLWLDVVFQPEHATASSWFSM